MGVPATAAAWPACFASGAPQPVDLRVVGWTFDAAVPRSGVRVPVLIAFTVGLVMLFVERDQIVQRKAVMGVMKLMLAHGLRPCWLKMAPEAHKRWVNAAAVPSPFQKPRTSSRNLSFHSAQPGGNSPTW